jgi:hypothetical protein
MLMQAVKTTKEKNDTELMLRNRAQAMVCSGEALIIVYPICESKLKIPASQPPRTRISQSTGGGIRIGTNPPIPIAKIKRTLGCRFLIKVRKVTNFIQVWASSCENSMFLDKNIPQFP